MHRHTPIAITITITTTTTIAIATTIEIAIAKTHLPDFVGKRASDHEILAHQLLFIHSNGAHAFDTQSTTQ
ncbi:hypothetical protein [Desulfatirhabdium butyrativorans]|uniref:hypothetical protein n=1 Tax=Desulfatirhabdium butyrativorans TaxID=340467 RepID=UPI00040C8151|nr:hypothetical protein [Desulfatirhabdium butyrativorans]